MDKSNRQRQEKRARDGERLGRALESEFLELGMQRGIALNLLRRAEKNPSLRALADTAIARTDKLEKDLRDFLGETPTETEVLTMNLLWGGVPVTEADISRATEDVLRKAEELKQIQKFHPPGSPMGDEVARVSVKFEAFYKRFFAFVDEWYKRRGRKS